MFRVQRSGAWRAFLPGAPGDNPYRGWLADEGSLTARIRGRCGEFRVALVRQALARPYGDEAPLLGLRCGERAWVREVVLQADGVPVVFAHSVLPRGRLRGPWRLFAGMGAKPLGAALFADPRIEREPFQFRRLSPRDPLLRRARDLVPALPQRLWARRSVFRRGAAPLLVSEVFLPGILALR